MKKPKKTSIEWRAPKNQREVFVNDQITTDAAQVNGRWRIHYYMAKDPTTEHTYYVPSDNLTFIEKAVTERALKREVPYWVTIEKDECGLHRWIKIEEC